MPENKKQHYLPQFYLRNFSRDQKQIFVYLLESKNAVLSPISSTCQGKYFYGIDIEFEQSLKLLEDSQAPVIKKIIETVNVANLTIEELAHIHTFLILQYTRNIPGQRTLA